MNIPTNSEALPLTNCSASLTLDEFIFEQLKLLEDFESSWRELHLKNDEIYPLEMFAGDWSEQLAFWREREDSILPNDDVEAPADQAPIQLGTLSPVASHALFCFYLLCFRRNLA